MKKYIKKKKEYAKWGIGFTKKCKFGMQFGIWKNEKKEKKCKQYKT